MVKLANIIVIMLIAVLCGCGTQGGSSSSSSDSTSSGSGADSGSDAGGDTSDSTIVDVGTDIVDGTTAVAAIDTIGVELEDLGDLVGSVTNPWYYTRASGVSDDGFVIGQTNAGSIVKAGFLWNPANATMTFVGIHNGTYDNFYGLNLESTSENFFIYSEAVSVASVGGAQLVLGNSTTGTNWPNESEKRAFLYNSATNSVVDLPPPSYLDNTGKRVVDAYSEGVQVNNQGEVILTADGEDGRQAYYWDGSTMRTVAFLASDDSSVVATEPDYHRLGRIIGQDSEAVSINENKQAVINSGDTAVFEDLNDNAIEVLNFFPGESATTAVDMNDNGHIVGISGGEGFFWRGGSMYPMGHLGGGSSEAVDVNNNDVVAGNSTISSGSTHAVVWSLVAGKGQMLDLGTLGGNNSYVTAINDAGQVVGYSETGDTYSEGGQDVAVIHGFLWQGGVMYDLGTHHDFYDYPFEESYPMSEAVAISENGDVAGNSLTINSHSRGFYFKVAAP